MEFLCPISLQCPQRGLFRDGAEFLRKITLFALFSTDRRFSLIETIPGACSFGHKIFFESFCTNGRILSYNYFWRSIDIPCGSTTAGNPFCNSSISSCLKICVRSYSGFWDPNLYLISPKFSLSVTKWLYEKSCFTGTGENFLKNPLQSCKRIFYSPVSFHTNAAIIVSLAWQAVVATPTISSKLFASEEQNFFLKSPK